MVLKGDTSATNNAVEGKRDSTYSEAAVQNECAVVYGTLMEGYMAGR